MKKKESLRILSLFSGCGGMDLGFEGNFPVLRASVNPAIHPEWARRGEDVWARLPETGLHTVFANDIKPFAKTVWVKYFSRFGNSPSDFALESVVDLVKRAQGGEWAFPAADIVTGGFPCQDFSLAGKRKGFESHKGHHGRCLEEVDNPSEENRGKLYMWMRAVIDLVRPKLFVAENVKGLLSLGDTKRTIESDFRTVGGGYAVVNARVLRAADYGVPQIRERVIFYGFREDALTPEALKALRQETPPSEYDPYPRPTHSRYPEKDGLLPRVTARQAFIGLSEPEESSDPAQRKHSLAKWYGRHCQGNREIDLDLPGPTIRSEHHGNIEFRRLAAERGGANHDELANGLKERRLTPRECARLQTFPDDFEFVIPSGPDRIGASSAYKLIGNAVPPLLAYHIADRIKTLWPKWFKA